MQSSTNTCGLFRSNAKIRTNSKGNRVLIAEDRVDAASIPTAKPSVGLVGPFRDENRAYMLLTTGHHRKYVTF